MASKKVPELEIPVNEDQELEKAAEKSDAMAAEAQLKAQQAEIEKLRKQLAEAQKAPARQQPKDDAQAVKQAINEAITAGKDLWTVTVPVRAPRRPGKEDPWYWLSVNGLSVQVPADDRYHDLKLPWAEALINSLDAEKRAADFQDNLEVFDPITNPHRDF